MESNTLSVGPDSKVDELSKVLLTALKVHQETLIARHAEPLTNVEVMAGLALAQTKAVFQQANHDGISTGLMAGLSAGLKLGLELADMDPPSLKEVEQALIATHKRMATALLGCNGDCEHCQYYSQEH